MPKLDWAETLNGGSRTSDKPCAYLAYKPDGRFCLKKTASRRIFSNGRPRGKCGAFFAEEENTHGGWSEWLTM